jgi:hypothetical protein
MYYYYLNEKVDWLERKWMGLYDHCGVPQTQFGNSDIDRTQTLKQARYNVLCTKGATVTNFFF